MLACCMACWSTVRHVGLLIVMLDSCSTAERSQTPFWVSVVKLHPGSTVQHGDHESSMAPSSSNCEQRPEHGELAPTWRPETPILQPDQNCDTRSRPPPCWALVAPLGVMVAFLVAAAMVRWVQPPPNCHNFIRSLQGVTWVAYLQAQTSKGPGALRRLLRPHVPYLKLLP